MKHLSKDWDTVCISLKKEEKEKAKALFGCAEKGKVFRFQSSYRTQFHPNKKNTFYNVHSVMPNSYHQFY